MLWYCNNIKKSVYVYKEFFWQICESPKFNESDLHYIRSRTEASKAYNSYSDFSYFPYVFRLC